MKLTKTIAAGLTGLALTAAALATSASAEETETTITLEAGTLSIDAPSTATGSASAAPGSAITVNVAATSVVDNRGSLLGWTVTGSSSDFVKAATASTAASTMPKAGFTWTTGTIATSNGSLTGVALGAGGSMGAPFAVATAIVGAGAGTYTYPATVTGLVPVNVIAGNYVGKITQSVL